MVSRIETLDLDKIRERFLSECKSSFIAIDTELANSQHYELPTMFYEKILGKNMKYSGSIWGRKGANLDDADYSTLDIYIERAGIDGGSNVLDLGAGWGSLSLAIADRCPSATVTALTNSVPQADYIELKAKLRGLENVEVVKEDVQKYVPNDSFDRVVSIEMFEHMRNPGFLMDKVFDWLTPQGKLFIQVFSHRCFPQFFDNLESSWMSRNFFSGGLMPYDGFYNDVSEKFKLESSWKESGISYHQTLESWLGNFDSNRQDIFSDLESCKGDVNSKHFFNQYRFFLLFCSELFKFNNGDDWYVINYLFDKSSVKAN